MSQERVSGFLEKGADLRESPGTSGELAGKSGKLAGKLWIAVKFHSERRRTSGLWELPGKPEDF